MRATYQWLARLIAIGVVLQAAFIAFGMFDIVHAAGDGRAYTGSSEYNIGQTLHSVVGYMVIPLLALLLLILSFFAKVPGGVRFAAIVAGLVVLQIVLALVSVPVPALGLLHGLNAFALAAVAGIAGTRGTRTGTDASRTETPAAA